MLENLHFSPLGKISDQTIEKYQALVSPTLLKVWENYGYGKCLDGLIWLTDPCEWEGILTNWLPNLHNSVACARTAFGCVYLYHEGNAYYLDVLEKDIIPIWGNLEMLFSHFFQDDIYLEEILDRELFSKAVAAYGELNIDECFGFHPTLSMGGSKELENIKKVALREYLHILLYL